MYLLGEPLEKVRTFQSHVVRLAMGADMWAARCRLVHPGGTTGLSSPRAASGEYATALEFNFKRRRRNLILRILINFDDASTFCGRYGPF
jgi:hypothetical protein